MRYLVILLATFLLAPATSIAQHGRYALDVGTVYGQETGYGWSTGGTKLNGQVGSLSHAGVRMAYKNEVDKWGRRDKTVGQREFPEHIVDTGYTSTTFGGAVGVRAWKQAHVLATLEYKRVYFVQERLGDTTELDGEERYYTQYRAPDKSSWGIGGGVKFFVPISGSFMITPAIMGSTTSKLILSVGVAVGDTP